MPGFDNSVFQTWLENPGKIARVAKMLPLKQGLKHHFPLHSSGVFKVAKMLPLKQGLKRLISNRSAPSSDVAKMLPLKQGLKLEVDGVIYAFAYNVAKMLPLKQGLKLYVLIIYITLVLMLQRCFH